MIESRLKGVLRLLSFGLAWSPLWAVALAVPVPNGNMELPVVGNWTATLPTNWVWTGSTSPGLTHTGGALGTQQTLFGNNIRRLYVNGIMKDKNATYGPSNLAVVFSGSPSGRLYTTDGLLTKYTLLLVL